MDQSGVKEILKALELHGAHMEMRFEQIDQRFEQVDRRFEQVDRRFEQMDHRFEKLEERMDRLEKKFDGHKIELIETQETVDHLATKTNQHERKLRKLIQS